MNQKIWCVCILAFLLAACTSMPAPENTEPRPVNVLMISIDDSPVDLTFYDRENREIQVEASSQPLGE